MATKITRDVLESYLHCKTKGYLKLTGQQGTKCDYEVLMAEQRAEVRLAAIDRIVGKHPGDEVARNIPLTAGALKKGPLYVLIDSAKPWRSPRSLRKRFPTLIRRIGHSVMEIPTNNTRSPWHVLPRRSGGA